jgi:hypothetical protein
MLSSMAKLEINFWKMGMVHQPMNGLLCGNVLQQFGHIAPLVLNVFLCKPV